MGLHQQQQLVEDEKFHLELDTVDDGLVGGLDLEVVEVLGDEQTRVEEDDKGVDGDELADNLALDALADLEYGLQARRRLVDVEAGDDGLLDEEAGELHALVNVKGAQEVVRSPGVAAEEQDGDGHVQHKDVGDNHVQHPADLAAVVHNQMQARVQHDGLAGDHAPPSDAGEHAEGKVGPERVVAEQDDDGVKRGARGGDEHAPEVQAAVVLEAAEDEDEDLQTVVGGDGEQAGNDHVDGHGLR